MPPKDYLETPLGFGRRPDIIWKVPSDLGGLLAAKRQHEISYKATLWLEAHAQTRKIRMARLERLAALTGISPLMFRRKLRGENTMTLQDTLLIAHHIGLDQQAEPSQKAS
jgi:hypothetical protein